MPLDALRRADDPGLGAWWCADCGEGNAPERTHCCACDACGVPDPVPHWHEPADVRSAAGWTLVMLAWAWLAGQAVTLVLLDERLLRALGLS